MILKSELTYENELGRTPDGKYVKCDNPNCPNAYHFSKDVSYRILNQDRQDGSIIDLAFCSLKCLIEIDPIKERFKVEGSVEEI